MTINRYNVLVTDPAIRYSSKWIVIHARDGLEVDSICSSRGLLALDIVLA